MIGEIHHDEQLWIHFVWEIHHDEQGMDIPKPLKMASRGSCDG